MEGKNQNRITYQMVGLMLTLFASAAFFTVAKAQICKPYWSCTVWSSCHDDKETRTCTDLNSCNSTRRPPEQQACHTGPEIVTDVGSLAGSSDLVPTSTGWSSGCSPIWSCTDWSNCQNGVQTRACTDLNRCNASVGQPSETFSCSGSAATPCTPDWNCTNWSVCINGNQVRSCVDRNNCGTLAGKPSEGQSCTVVPSSPAATPTPATGDEPVPVAPCAPNWSCTLWSVCVNSAQTRTCSDLNRCGVETGLPDRSQSCTMPSAPLPPVAPPPPAPNAPTPTPAPLPLCTPNWSCALWSSCADGSQTRTCADLNNCGATTNRPEEQKSCTAADAACISSWSCTAWSICASGSQARSCVDLNHCNVAVGKPDERQACTVAPAEQPAVPEPNAPPGGPLDQTAPVISGVLGVATGYGAEISWQTDEPASSAVEFGTTVSFGQQVSSPTGILVSQHRLSLYGLSVGTSYYLRLVSADATGNTAYAGPYILTTLASAGDSDGDGLIDAYEFRLGTNAQKPDTDGDGLGDARDARPLTVDPPGKTAPAKDSDNDGLLDVFEKQLGTDSKSADSDRDGVPDRWDAFPLDKKQSRDTDGDGISDEQERQIGTNPYRRDTDGDGVDDGAEVRSSNDPLASGLNATSSVALSATALCTDYPSLRERVRCRLQLSVQERARQDAVQYAPEECRAVSVSARSACIAQLLELQLCHQFTVGTPRTECAKRIIKIGDAAEEFAACVQAAKNQQAKCREALRQKVYQLIRFRIAQLGARAEALLAGGVRLDLVTDFITAQEVALQHFNAAEIKDQRRAAILEARAAWQTFVTGVAPGIR